MADKKTNKNTEQGKGEETGRQAQQSGVGQGGSGTRQGQPTSFTENQATGSIEPGGAQEQTGRESGRSNASRFGRESWGEFSRRSTQPPQQEFIGRSGQSANIYDQGRPTQEWERTQEQEFGRGGRSGFDEGRRRANFGGRVNDQGTMRGQANEPGFQGGYGSDTGFNREGGRLPRGREDYDRGEHEYGRSSGRFGAERGNREFGQARGYGEESGRGSFSVERGAGRGERGERTPGGQGQTMGRVDYDYEPGNRENTGQHRYGGDPRSEESGYQGYRGPDYPRFNRAEDVRNYDREFRRDFERQRSEEDQQRRGRGGQQREDYRPRGSGQDFGGSSRSAGSRDRQGGEGRPGPARGGREDREGRDWSRDQISEGYNAGDYGRQQWRRGEEGGGFDRDRRRRGDEG